MQKTISITKETYDKLKVRAHPGQTFDGVIRELLGEYAFNPPVSLKPIDKKLEPSQQE